jgi:hypothetical protein
MVDTGVGGLEPQMAFQVTERREKLAAALVVARQA